MNTRLPLVVAEARSTQALVQLWKEKVTARIFWSLAKKETDNALYIFTFLYLVEGVNEVVLEKDQGETVGTARRRHGWAVGVLGLRI
jgi:hypothetical protein